MFSKRLLSTEGLTACYLSVEHFWFCHCTSVYPSFFESLTPVSSSISLVDAELLLHSQTTQLQFKRKKKHSPKDFISYWLEKHLTSSIIHTHEQCFAWKIKEFKVFFFFNVIRQVWWIMTQDIKEIIFWLTHLRNLCTLDQHKNPEARRELQESL